MNEWTTAEIIEHLGEISLACGEPWERRVFGAAIKRLIDYEEEIFVLRRELSFAKREIAVLEDQQR